jgi:hypothetical protein
MSISFNILIFKIAIQHHLSLTSKKQVIENIFLSTYWKTKSITEIYFNYCFSHKIQCFEN